MAIRPQAVPLLLPMGKLPGHRAAAGRLPSPPTGSCWFCGFSFLLQGGIYENLAFSDASGLAKGKQAQLFWKPVKISISASLAATGREYK
jgi:hypothetical protein